MPTLFVIFGFRFLFYSDDHEPIHVHVIKDGHEAKYNIEPLEQIRAFYTKKSILKVISGEGTIKEIVDEMDKFIQSRI